jgi:GAF domain-containing protein
MFTRISNYFTDEDDHTPSFINLTRNILIFVLVTNLALIPLVTGLVGEGSQNPIALTVLSVTLTLELISFFLVLNGKVRMAKVIVPIALVIAATIISLSTNGLKNTSMAAYPVILVISAILLGRRALVLITPLVVVSVTIVAVFDLRGSIPFIPSGLDDAIILPILYIGGAGITHMLIMRLNENIARARQSEETQKIENAELNTLRAELEERVRERTAALETANTTNQKRARQFEAVTQVLSAISTLQNIDTLLPRITEVISDQFNVYHAGIFMLDRNQEYAILRAANSEGGQQMLANGHKLQIGQTGIVGAVASTGNARIALDVGADAAYFNNPYLPETHSEIALPLQYGGQIIGVLDVQSTEPNAFGQDDVEVLTTLADQVAIAINNSQAIEEAEKSLREARSAIGESTKETWQVMRPKSLGAGFQLTETAVKPLGSPITGSHIREAMEQGKPVLVTDENNETKFAIPIQLRGQTFGVIHLNRNGGAPLTTDETEIAVAVANRLSLAIETATLIQATQHRAEVERVTTDITSRISSSTRFENILQTAAQELSRALGGEVLVQIEPVSMKMIMDT